ncbi:MAG TPA: hypothetical protein VGN15_00485 [Ktedonobacteraceae bacterium]|jgi:hypothetical protein|nr:hypothetical protein [Ktedonobacteraceae bacterium]
MLPDYEIREMLSTRVRMATYLLQDWKFWTEDDIPRILKWLKRGQQDLAELIDVLEGKDG